VSPASGCYYPRTPEVVSAQLSPKAWKEMTNSKQVYSSLSGWCLIRLFSAVFNAEVQFGGALRLGFMDFN